MTEEKSIEELRAELESLKKQNLEREIAKEKDKIEAEQKAVKEAEIAKEKAAMETEIREKIMEEMKGSSLVADSQTVESNVSKADSFMTEFKQKYGYGGTSYEELTKKITSPGNYKRG